MSSYYTTWIKSMLDYGTSHERFKACNRLVYKLTCRKVGYICLIAMLRCTTECGGAYWKTSPRGYESTPLYGAGIHDITTWVTMYIMNAAWKLDTVQISKRSSCLSWVIEIRPIWITLHRSVASVQRAYSTYGTPYFRDEELEKVGIDSVLSNEIYTPCK